MMQKTNCDMNHFMDMLAGLPEHIMDSLHIHTEHFDTIIDWPDKPLPQSNEPICPEITIVGVRCSATHELLFRFERGGKLVDVMKHSTQQNVASVDDGFPFVVDAL